MIVWSIQMSLSTMWWTLMGGEDTLLKETQRFTAWCNSSRRKNTTYSQSHTQSHSWCCRLSTLFRTSGYCSLLMCIFECVFASVCVCTRVCVTYLSIAGSVVDQTRMFSGAAQLRDGLRFTHHPPHTLQMTVLKQQTQTQTQTHTHTHTHFSKDQLVGNLSSR